MLCFYPSHLIRVKLNLASIFFAGGGGRCSQRPWGTLKDILGPHLSWTFPSLSLCLLLSILYISLAHLPLRRAQQMTEMLCHWGDRACDTVPGRHSCLSDVLPRFRRRNPNLTFTQSNGRKKMILSGNVIKHAYSLWCILVFVLCVILEVKQIFKNCKMKLGRSVQEGSFWMLCTCLQYTVYEIMHTGDVWYWQKWQNLFTLRLQLHT